MEEIASAAGVSRRTLFRYYPSKNDIVWGDFDAVLVRLREELEDGPEGEPVSTAIRRAVIASNSYPEEQLEDLRIRMNLITSVPALQGHSMLRYQAWRQVVAEFVADREGLEANDLRPVVIGYAALGTAMSAFTVWVRDPGSDHEALIGQGFDDLGIA
jgi:mycofactocin system transcriptional regulator